MITAGTHVHPVDEPTADLTVDVVAAQGSDPAWLVTHDPAGTRRYVRADQAVRHGRHERPQADPRSQPGVVAGVLPVPPWPHGGAR